MPSDVTQYRERLFHHAYSKTGKSHVADDLVQEAFSRWYQADRSSVHTPYAWLVTVVNHLCIDYWRRNSREISVDAMPIGYEHSAPESGMELWCDLVEAVSLTLHSLTPEQRAALILRDVFDWTYADIAAALHKNGSACRQLVHRARVTLQRKRSPLVPQHAQIATMFVRAVLEEDAAAAIETLARADPATRNGYPSNGLGSKVTRTVAIFPFSTVDQFTVGQGGPVFV